MEKNWKVGVLMIMIILIFFGISYVLDGKEIKEANINGYAFLESISKCDIQYKVDILNGGATAEFKEECLEDSLFYLEDIGFKPGEKGEKFLLESKEYLNCAYIHDLKGSEEYKKCVKEILPILREKFPEVVKE